MTFKVQPPRLSVGDSWGDLRVISYEGYKQTPYTSKKKAHHYRVLCACGERFTQPQTRLFGKNRMEQCPECGNKKRVARIREFARTPAPTQSRENINVMTMWPVPGRQA